MPALAGVPLAAFDCAASHFAMGGGHVESTGDRAAIGKGFVVGSSGASRGAELRH